MAKYYHGNLAFI